MVKELRPIKPKLSWLRLSCSCGATFRAKLSTQGAALVREMWAEWHAGAGHAVIEGKQSGKVRHPGGAGDPVIGDLLAKKKRSPKGIDAMTKFCQHCRKPYNTRTGRGLCRSCYDDPAIKKQYAPIAPFGGAEASAIWKAAKAKS